MTFELVSDSFTHFNLAILLGQTVSSQFTCPVVDDLCMNGQYPDPASCSHFYQCSPAIEGGCDTIRFECPQGFAFDALLFTCVTKEGAICTGNFKTYFKNRRSKENKIQVKRFTTIR